MTQKKIWCGLLLSFLICFAASGIGAFATTSQIDGWYASLTRPAYAPPNWVFGPVWTILYAMMAIAAWLVWKQDGFRKAAVPLTMFAVQLVLNVLWSVLFFGRQNPGAALIEIVLLWMAILATIVLFAKRSKSAAVLLIPYWLWVSFAVVLNYGFWSLNR